MHTFAPEIPTGAYSVRAVSVERSNSKADTPGIRVCFVIVDGPFEGRKLWEDYWLTPAAGPYTKRTLHTIGFGDLTMSQIGMFTGFVDLPILFCESGRTRKCATQLLWVCCADATRKVWS